MSTRKSFTVIILVLVAMLVISSVAAAGGGFWKGRPNTVDNCVTTYLAPDNSAPIGRACFRWTKLDPGFFNCSGNTCYIRMYQGTDWLRTDEVDVTG